MSNYKRLFIINDPTMLRIIPSLAEEIGLNESIVLLQIEFWISISDNKREGKKWTYQTVREMEEKAFPFWGKSTIHRTVRNLVDRGYLVEGSFNKKKYDRTGWYALGDKIAELKSVSLINVEVDLSQNGTNLSQNGTHLSQNGTTIPEITTENTTETTIDVENQTSPINEDQKQNTETIKTSNASNKEVTPKSEDSGIEDTFKWVNAEEDHSVIEEMFPPMNDVHLGHLSSASKRKAKFEEKFKNKGIPDFTAWDKERVRKGEKTSAKGGAKVKTSPLNSSVIITRFGELYNSFFSEIVPMSGIKEKTLMKNMIDHYGYEYVETMLVWMFENWAEFKRECKLQSTPNLRILYSFRDYLQEKVRNRVEESKDLHEF